MIEKFSQDEETIPPILETLTDPMVKYIMDKVQQVQDNIDANPDIDDESLALVLSQLNHLWPYHNRTLEVSGWLEQYSAEDHRWIEHQWFDEAHAISHGFTIRRLFKDTEQRPTIVHNLQCRDERTQKNYQVTAPIDSHITYPLDSLESVRNRLRLYSPYAYDEITHILSFEQTETDILKALSRHKLKQNPQAYFNVGKDMERYVNDLIYFDSVPYVIKVEDEYYELDGQQASPVRHDDSMLAIQPDRVRYIAIPHKYEPHYRIPALLARQLVRNKHEKPPQLLIPLSAITHVQSMREQFYQDKP